MTTTLRIAGLAVFYMSLLTLSTSTFADPFVYGNPDIYFSVYPPPSDYSLSYNVLVPSFAVVTTTGGGIADMPAPSASISGSSIVIGSGVEGSPPGSSLPVGGVTTTGPGSASEDFGESVLATITNTSSIDETLPLSFSMGWWIDTLGNSPNATLSFNIFTAIVPSSPNPQIPQIYASFVGGCSATGPFGDDQGLDWGSLPPIPPCSDISGTPCDGEYDCFDWSGVDGDVFIPAGQSLSWDLVMDITFSVDEVPEPSSLLLLAAILGVGLYLLRRKALSPPPQQAQ